MSHLFLLQAFNGTPVGCLEFPLFWSFRQFGSSLGSSLTAAKARGCCGQGGVLSALAGVPAVSLPVEGPCHCCVCSSNIETLFIATHATLGCLWQHHGNHILNRMQLPECWWGPENSVIVTPVLQELLWLPTVFHVQFQVLVLIYKAPNSLGHGYLKDLLLLYHLSCALHLAGEVPLVIPQAREAVCTWRAFSVVDPLLWNSLPLKAPLILSLSVFWCCMKTAVSSGFVMVMPSPVAFTCL